MDGLRSMETGNGGGGHGGDAALRPGHSRLDDSGVEAPPLIGTDERRMQVRAYNFWSGLLGERAYPAIDDLDLDALDDFGPNAVLLDFTAGVDNPGIGFIGERVRRECALDDDVHYLDQIPGRSLLSRLTDHYLQIIANRAPIGFEAEFVNDRGVNILYRGILLPFSSDDDTIDFILGVINWKQAAPQDQAEALQREVETALRHAPAPSALAPVWADGPVSDLAAGADDLVREAADDTESLADPEPDAGLADWLAVARETAVRAQDADGRSRTALYDAVSRAYDFALVAAEQPADFAELLSDAGLTVQERAPMTPVVKLVFGAAYDKTRITEYACVLSHARSAGLGRGDLKAYLDRYQGGLKALVRDERARRRPATKPDTKREAAAAALRAAVPMGFIECDDGGTCEFVVMVARRVGAGQLAVVGVAADDAALIDRAVKAAAHSAAR